MGSVNTMVDGGMHGFKPYVHSDCGGDHRYTGADLVRWVAHCAFGSIMRLHGNDHRPWTYDNEIEADVRSYLLARARLAPSLIAAGHKATSTAFPPVARGDFYWPEHGPLAASNTQYIFLDSLLVAPMDTVCYERSGSPDTETNGGICDPAAGSVPPRSADVHGWGWQCGSSTRCNTNASGGSVASTRNVWIPPGQWHDAWNGTVLIGPRIVEVVQPYHQQPMWHKAGSMLVLCDKPGMRVTEQDWSTLTLEVFPAPIDSSTSATTINDDIGMNGSGMIETKQAVYMYEQSDAISPSDVDHTFLRLSGGGDGTTSKVRVEIGAGEIPRAWNVRINMLPGQTVINGSIVVRALDDYYENESVAKRGAVRQQANISYTARLIHPYGSNLSHSMGVRKFFPLSGAGSPSAPGAGLVVEIALGKSQHGRVLELQLNTATILERRT